MRSGGIKRQKEKLFSWFKAKMVRVKSRLAILSRSSVDLSYVSLSSLPFSYQLPDELWHFPSLSWHKLLQLSLSNAVAFENKKDKNKKQTSSSQDLTTRVIIQYFFPSAMWLKDKNGCNDAAIKLSALVECKFAGRLIERWAEAEVSIKMRFFPCKESFCSCLSKSGKFLQFSNLRTSFQVSLIQSDCQDLEKFLRNQIKSHNSQKLSPDEAEALELASVFPAIEF